MGCDIHAFAEVVLPSERSVPERPSSARFLGALDWDRNYQLFAHLADVRNPGSVAAFDEPRGLPEDLSPEAIAECTVRIIEDTAGPASTASTVSTASIDGGEHPGAEGADEEEEEEWGVLRSVVETSPDYVECFPGRAISDSVDAHSHSWFTTEELAEIGRRYAETPIAGEERGWQIGAPLPEGWVDVPDAPVTIRMPQYRIIRAQEGTTRGPNEDITAAVALLRGVELETGGVARVVFYFDN